MFPIIYKCSIYFPLHCHFGHWSSDTGYECRGNIKPFHLNQHKVQDYFLLSQRIRGQPSAAIAVSCPEGVVGVLFYGETCAIKYSRTTVYCQLLLNHYQFFIYLYLPFRYSNFHIVG